MTYLILLKSIASGGDTPLNTASLLNPLVPQSVHHLLPASQR